LRDFRKKRIVAIPDVEIWRKIGKRKWKGREMVVVAMKCLEIGKISKRKRKRFKLIVLDIKKF